MMTWMDFDNVKPDLLAKIVPVVVGQEKLDDIYRLSKRDNLRFICFMMKVLNVLR